MVKKQFINYLFSGGIAASLNWGCRFLFSELFQFEVAVVLAYLVGLLSGFTLMRVFVFTGADKPVIAQAGKYVAVNLFALPQTVIISSVLARWALPLIGIFDHAEALAHFAGILVPVATSYFGHKYFSFR